MKKLFLICTVFALVLSAVPSLAEEIPDAVYRDECVTVTVDHITVSDRMVSAGFIVSCPEGRSCIVLPNFREEMMSSMDWFEALRMIRQIGGGKVAYPCRPGKSILCEFVWDLNQVYDYSSALAALLLVMVFSDTFPADSFQDLEPDAVPVPLKTDLFPAVAGFTILEGTGDITALDKEPFQGDVTDEICLLFSAEEKE